MESLPLTTLLLVGAVIVLSMALRYTADAVGLSPVVGFLALGLLLRPTTAALGLPPLTDQQVFPFLADLGVVALLFRVGLKSDLSRLLEQLPEALWIGLGNVLGSGGSALFVALVVLEWPLVPSLFAATALTATSVGVTVAVWEEAGGLDTREGTILVDVAELDDVVGIVLMALLFAVAPLLASGSAVGPTIVVTLGRILGILALFGMGCVLFARYLERPLTRLFERLHAGDGTMLVILGVGIIVAALADLGGLSLAIGAFFAGLIFSRDPSTTQYLDAFRPLHDLFAPFFFVGIGLHVVPDALTAIGPGLIALLLAAILGKVIGAYVPARPMLGSTGAAILGLSLVPRAEIALVIVQRGLELGPWAVPPSIFGTIVLISAITVVGTPLLLRPLLRQQLPNR
jgi:Kef-type K+ transport system membrane component KefB